MPLFNNKYSKSKKIILTLVLILTVGFGVLGVGERAWGIETADETPEVINLSEEEILNIYPENTQVDPLVENALQNIAAADTAGLGQPGPSKAKDTLQSILGSMIAWALYYIAVGLGWIFMLVAEAMLYIAVFNNFVGQPIVQQGWIIVRDICNNFFIVFMMILAGGVVLGLENYKWRAMLPKILLYAVLINFSLTLTGILIDVSQVLMLTFAAPLAGQMGKNLIFAAIGLPEMYNMGMVVENWAKGSSGDSTGIHFMDLIAALLFAIIVTIVTIVVVVCISAVLVWRIVLLIFLLVLSPLPFLARASNISQLKSLDSEWVAKLSNMLVVGPAMMFFLYLSFLMMAANVTSREPKKPIIDGFNQTTSTIQTGMSNVPPTNTNADQYSIKLSGLASVDGLLKFMLVIGFLWGSLMMGKRFGDAAGSIAGQGMAKLNAGAKKFSGFNLAKKAGSAASGRAKEFAGDVTGYSALTGATSAYFAKGKEDRAKARASRVTNLEGKISGGVSGFKSGVAFVPNWIGGQVNSKLWQHIGGNKAKILEEEVKTGKAQLEESKETLKSKREELETSQDTQTTLRKEAEDLVGVANRLNQYSSRANDNDFVVDDKRYVKQGDGSYNEIDVDTNNIIRKGIAQENLQEEVIGYKDEFQKLVNKARQDQSNGVRDANFEKDGYQYYLRDDGRGWNKVDVATGLEVETEINDNDLRRNATGNRDLNQEIETKVIEKTNQAEDLDSGIREKRREFQAQQSKFHEDSVDIGLKEEQSKRLQRRQNAMDKVAKTGLVAGTTIAGAALGGVFGPGAILGAALGYATGKGALGTANAVKEAGKADKKIFDNISHKQLTEAGKDLGDLDDDKIIAKIDDSSLSKFESMAFQLEAIKRGIVDANKAREIRDRILSGTALGGQNNKKIENLVDSALFKNKQYASLSKSYDQLNSNDPAKKKKGREAWEENVKDRKYKLKDLTKEATEKLIDVFVEKLDGSSFNAQFDEAKKDGKADQVIDALKKFIAQNPNDPNRPQAQQNLAKIIGVKEAYGDDNDGALEFIKKISTRDLEDLFEKDEKKFNQITELAEGRVDRFSKSVQSHLRASKGQALKNGLNIS